MSGRSKARHVLGLLALPALWLAIVAPAVTVLEPDFSEGVGEYPRACGRSLVPDGLDHVPLLDSVRVLLVTDEEWRAVVDDPTHAARQTVLDAAALFRGLGIHLLTVRTIAWTSPDDGATIRETWLAAQEQVPLGGEDIAIVMTAQPRTTAQDGYARVGGEYVAVAHHPGRGDRDALVLAHEISHLFGAHHGCDVAGREGLMTAEGFDEDLVCPCTRRVLELNATRFHEVGE